MTRYQTTKLINKILLTLTSSGVLGGSLLAPNASELFSKIGDKILDFDFDEKEMQKLIKYMEKTKLIELRLRNEEVYANLTNKARNRLKFIEIDDITIKTPKKWDKKWRIVIYDIPANKKENRYQLLEQLHRLGFYKIQDSTWVFPFSCSKEVLEILERLDIQNFATLIVGDIESKDENKLIKHFQLFKYI